MTRRYRRRPVAVNSSCACIRVICSKISSGTSLRKSNIHGWFKRYVPNDLSLLIILIYSIWPQWRLKSMADGYINMQLHVRHKSRLIYVNNNNNNNNNRTGIYIYIIIYEQWWDIKSDNQPTSTNKWNNFPSKAVAPSGATKKNKTMA